MNEQLDTETLESCLGLLLERFHNETCIHIEIDTEGRVTLYFENGSELHTDVMNCRVLPMNYGIEVIDEGNDI